MEAIEAICSRSSIRGFKPEPVPREVLEKVLEAARWAPSPRNMQVCELAVMGGKVMAEVKARYEEKVKAKVPQNADLPESDPPELYLKRAIEQMNAVDSHQFPPGTENLDAKRGEYWLKGGRLYDAPNSIIIYTDKALDYKAIISVGLTAQTIALAAHAHGLGTVMMTRAIQYPEILRELLGIPESKNIVLGIAIGYPDPNILVNSYPRRRLPLEAIAHWHGF